MRLRQLGMLAVAVIACSLLAPWAAAAAEPNTITDFPVGVTRLAGPNRYDTAVSVADRYAPGVPVVFVATGSNFPDALAAAAAAARLGGPLLLTPTDRVPDTVVAKIRALAPTEIKVLGSTSVVSAAAEAQLRQIAPTQRLGGTDRYDTALNVVNSTFTASTTAFIATGRSYPDALAATGAAGKAKAPVILLDGLSNTVGATIVDALQRLGVTEVSIVGSTAVVSAGIEHDLQSSFTVHRYAGADRYATTAAINNAFFAPGSTSTSFLATGADFPDALAGAALAGRMGAPMYITTGACTPAPIKSSIAALASATTVVLGSAPVVSDAAARNDGCLSVAAPSITGSAVVGSSLAAVTGTWTAGAQFTYQWYANGSAIGGATASALAMTSDLGGKRISVAVTGAMAGYVSTTMTSAQTRPVGYPSSTAPLGWDCPAWAPIKGNAASMIYHMPGQQFYTRTNPEVCFSSEQAAQAAGYRRSKV